MLFGLTTKWRVFSAKLASITFPMDLANNFSALNSMPTGNIEAQSGNVLDRRCHVLAVVMRPNPQLKLLKYC